MKITDTIPLKNRSFDERGITEVETSKTSDAQSHTCFFFVR